MSNFVYNEAKRAVLEGELDLNAADDIRVLLVMTNTTADTEDDANTFADFTTLDECDASAGYSSGGVALTGETVAEDSANDRAEFDADNASWSGLATATRQVQAAIVYKWNSTLNDSEPLIYVDEGGFPFDGGGANVTIQWNAEGILQAT